MIETITVTRQRPNAKQHNCKFYHYALNISVDNAKQISFLTNLIIPNICLHCQTGNTGILDRFISVK